jgi:glycosyltransferase involved in cell wall biosynthesis
LARVPSTTAALQPRSSTTARRILVCSPFCPRLDARHGGKATSQLLLHLAERNEVALLCLRTADERGVDPAIADRCAYVEEIKVQVNQRFPRRLVWGFGMLGGIPPWAMDCRSAEYAAALGRLLEEWRPEVVEIHFQAMAQYVKHLDGRDLPKILVDYDPASAWAEDLLNTTRGPRRLARRLEVAAWRRYERSTRPRFDAIVVFAQRDLAPVAASSGQASLVRIPLAVDIPVRPLDPYGSDPPRILFVGGFAHPPNVDAALWLGRMIFPRVLERVPAAKLELVGHEPGAEVRGLAQGPVSVHASVPDVTPYLDRAAVVVAPIRLGGSMRMKVLEALAAGKALLATPRAAEGVEAVAGEHYILAADEGELVDALASLLLDRGRRGELGKSARRWAERNLGWAKGVAAFEQLYDALVEAHSARLVAERAGRRAEGVRFLAPPRGGVGHAPAPSFSVIVAGYQVADVIGDALDSIRQQTLRPLEVIVCDDGSTDALEDALAPYRDEIIFERKSHGGEASAKNAAAARASGDFVVILDADDAFLPTRLEALTELAQARPDLDIITTDAYLVANGRRVRRNYDRTWRFDVLDQRRAILQRNFIFGHAAVRRELLLEHGGFDESIRWTTDWELWLRLILAGSRAGCVDEPLALYRLRESSLTAQRRDLLLGKLATLEKAQSNPNLREAERPVLEDSLAAYRRELGLLDLRDSLAAGNSGARRRALVLLRAPGQAFRLRLELAAMAAAPGASGRLLRRRANGSWVGAGGTRVPRRRG